MTRAIGIASLLAVALTGLSACSRPGGIEVRTVEVKVPVAVPCLRADQIPSEPEKIAGRLTGDAQRDLDIVTASALRLRAWGEAMRAALLACAQPTPATPG